MRSRIYLRKFGKLIRLYKFSRTQNGLYIVSFRSEGDNYITYHDDGRYWLRARGQKFIKKLRQPLYSFTGTESIISSIFTILQPAPDNLDEAAVHIKPDDFILEMEGTFGMEIILSENIINLPE